MHVGYGAIKERFRTRVTLKPQVPEILVEYLEAPSAGWRTAGALFPLELAVM